MPSTRLLAAALAAMVLVSGCSALPGGGADTTPEQTASGSHELAFYSNTDGAPYNGTLTVQRNGDVVEEVPLDEDGTGTYVDVATFDEAGEYTVVVNTSLPESGGGTMREAVTVDGALGNATVLTMDYQGVSRHSYPLGGDGDGAVYLDKRIPEPIEYPLRVSYRGETVVDTTVADDATRPFEVASLRGAGVYRVAVRGTDENWTNETVVVTEAGGKIGVHVQTPPEIRVYGADQSVPNDP